MAPITQVNLANVDLNLFHVLHTVLEERSATGAARRLHVTQSAVSNALARLRQLMGDPLVVRGAGGLVPTPRAAALAPLVAAALSQLRAVVAADSGFDPATTTQRFTLACSDSEAVALLPSLPSTFAQHMPRACLRMVPLDQQSAAGALARGEIDALIGLPHWLPPECRSVPLYTDDIVAIVRQGHPAIKGRKLSLDEYFSTPHAMIELFFDGRESSIRRAIDKILDEHERRPTVALSLPQFHMVALAVSRTDCIGQLPRRIAEALSVYLPIRILEPPFRMPELPLVLIWHERTQSDPGSSLFRRSILEALGASNGRPGSPRATPASRSARSPRGARAPGGRASAPRRRRARRSDGSRGGRGTT
jgi:DNA-binding transcriptional LysR family regulator